MSKLLSMLLFKLVIIPFSSLPMGIIYRISDFVYLILYKVIGYRKEVTRMNLQKSFPNKTFKELLQIETDFYSQFCDNILEGLKGLTISKKEISKRMVCKNPELLDSYFEKGKSVIITTGHYYSWEWWFLGIDMPVKHKIILLYRKLSNQYFEKKLDEIRRSFGTIPLQAEKVKTFFKEKENGQYGYIFATDHSVNDVNKSYWLTFLNQETPVAFGAEKLAVDFDVPVVFSRIKKIKRGYYEFEYIDVEAEPTKTQLGDITKAHTQVLEDTIKEDPAGWLWSHRRWKRERPEGIEIHD